MVSIKAACPSPPAPPPHVCGCPCVHFGALFSKAINSVGSSLIKAVLLECLAEIRYWFTNLGSV